MLWVKKCRNSSGGNISYLSGGNISYLSGGNISYDSEHVPHAENLELQFGLSGIC